MKRRRLSAKAVEKQRRAGYFADGGGLYLQCSPTRAKSWIFRHTLRGRAREMGLGSTSTVSLAEARHRAQQARKLLGDRIDPIEHRNAHRAAQALDKARQITFGECAHKYIEAHRAGWRNAKHIYQWTYTIDTYCGPIIGALPVADVDTGLLALTCHLPSVETPLGDGQGDFGQDAEEMIELKPIRLTECLHLLSGATLYTAVFRSQPIYTTTFLRRGDPVCLLLSH